MALVALALLALRLLPSPCATSFANDRVMAATSGSIAGGCASRGGRDEVEFSREDEAVEPGGKMCDDDEVDVVDEHEERVEPDGLATGPPFAREGNGTVPAEVAAAGGDEAGCGVRCTRSSRSISRDDSASATACIEPPDEPPAALLACGAKCVATKLLRLLRRPSAAPPPALPADPIVLTNATGENAAAVAGVGAGGRAFG